MTMASTQTVAAPDAEKRRDLSWLTRFAPLIFLLLLVLFFGLANERFLSTRNLFNIFTEVSVYGLMAIGMTYVVLTGGIDLSVGAILALAGMVAAIVITGGANNSFSLNDAGAQGFGWPVGLLAAAAVGTCCGLAQGLAVTRLRVPPFVVTLGGMSIFRGATLLLGGGGPLGVNDEGLRWWGRGRILWDTVPVPVLIFAIVAFLGFFILRYTRFGRRIYFIGGNAEAARLAGIDVKRVLLFVYAISGILSGLAGFIMTARLGSAEAVAGVSFELRVIASVIIGGTSLFGGIGTIGGTIVGSILIGVLLNGLVMLNVNSYWQEIIVGSIIILAVAFNILTSKRRAA
ncbi:inositol transport system permease protein [Rhizobium sp. BK181]|uniref:ABC transporter permease n=1 Tax=Rhizobium sp. BK181 TaxID=2587072 RepID=UPI00160F156F|nr:ABC transporter permease [Rhizobium sp. BK181]MBB3317587.1 inositol transport system permease protein [Rhizobium sp. BK181]